MNGVLTYDARLADAAEGHGFDVYAPTSGGGDQHTMRPATSTKTAAVASSISG